MYRQILTEDILTSQYCFKHLVNNNIISAKMKSCFQTNFTENKLKIQSNNEQHSENIFYLKKTKRKI